MICKKINKSFKCCRFVVIINPTLLVCPYYISSKIIIRSSKPEPDYRIVYNIYKNSNIIFFWTNSLDFEIK